MKNLIIVLIILMSIARCGSGDGGVETPTGNDDLLGKFLQCPTGEIFSTNGMRDLIAVGNTGVFQMERNGAAATGYITCHGNQEFTLVIQSQFGNCTVANSCVENEVDQQFKVMEPGTYNCQYSVNDWIVTVWCSSPGNQATGNVLNPAKTYFLPGYY